MPGLRRRPERQDEAIAAIPRQRRHSLAFPARPSSASAAVQRAADAAGCRRNTPRRPSPTWFRRTGTST